MIDWNARQHVLGYIAEHPRCLSRDISSALGLTIREATDACTFMHRDGAIERNAGMLASWSIILPPEPSISVSVVEFRCNVWLRKHWRLYDTHLHNRRAAYRQDDAGYEACR